MTARPLSARTMARILREAIARGDRMVDLRPDGTSRILPIGADPAQADDAALDAEIESFVARDGHRGP